MKKVAKSNELMWILGIIFVALGVCICKKADLGVSMIAAPTFILYEALKDTFSWLSAGTMEYIIQGFLVILLSITTQRFHYKYLFAFLTAVLYGCVLDLWLLIFGSNPFNGVALRWSMLILGDVVCALGVACFFRTYMPLLAFELFVAEFSKRYNIVITKFKQIFDVTCLIVSIILAMSIFRDVKTFDWSKIYMTSYHSIGLGTIVTTIINAPIILYIGKGLDKIFEYNALIPKLEKFFSNSKENKIEDQDLEDESK